MKIYLKCIQNISIFPKICEVKQPLRSDETENEDNNWEELLLSGGLKSLFFLLNTLLKKHSLPYKKKIEK